ncbi:MAG: RsmB/NOP family class I SAM-dependent RNA methyltransferase [Flavobacteriales bacterium]|nr:RsmB/NOP family class I SAM-dependent RNA methyltransferase [Flavobacteriales bacterium]
MKYAHLSLFLEMIPRVFVRGQHADRVLFETFNRYEIPALEKKEISTTFYDLIRKWRLITAINSNNDRMEEANLYRLLGIYMLLNHQKLPKQPAFEKLHHENIHRKAQLVLQDPAVRSLLPNWLFERFSQELGSEATERLMKIQNEEPPVFIRVNTLKTTEEELFQILISEGLAPERTGISNALKINNAARLFKTKAFYEGKYEVQDLHSQQISLIVAPQPGQRIIDACAGAGGKTLHLAALMRNKGKIIALDVSEKKLQELQRRLNKAGVSMVESRRIDSKKVIKRLENSADVVLIDAPCSGTGVLRRNPDIRWLLDEMELNRLVQIQQELLNDYVHCVKPGGKVVYSTCSILPSENEKQIEMFLQQHPYSEVEFEQRLDATSQGGDGFYVAVIRKPF